MHIPSALLLFVLSLISFAAARPARYGSRDVFARDPYSEPDVMHVVVHHVHSREDPAAANDFSDPGTAAEFGERDLYTHTEKRDPETRRTKRRFSRMGAEL
ncbi:hypothetical protein MMC18_004711 [Xylographa bjoerkii]|nr:hypothetical protein [Xylographa bjoerkii]